jgi:DNA polymerase-3 subunit delta
MRLAKNGRFMPIYVCYGRETYLMQEFIAFIVDQAVPEEYRDLAVSKYNLNDVPLAEVLDDAETAPFLAPKKVVIADQAWFLTGAKEKSKAEHDTDRLLAYAASPAEDTVLILKVTADKLDERKKLVKALKANDALIPFQPMDHAALLKWIATQAGRRRVAIGEEAADRLLMNTGADLQQIAAELDKCSLYVGEGGEITAETVDRLVPRTVEQTVFVLIDEIVRRRFERAMDVFYDLLRQREEPIRILALIARQFRLIFQVGALSRRGLPDPQIAAEIGAHPYAVKLAREQSKLYREAELARILDELAEFDYRMKTGRSDKVGGLEMFLLGLAAAGAEARDA